jgi:pimeloyl-ACP methyl ester carboxylesterase
MLGVEKDLRVRALLAGKGDTTLVFLHGYGESLLAWRGLVAHFTDRYRVLAVDLPGFGLSDPLPDSSGFDDYLDALGKVISRETTGPLVLVGHSMGGQVAAGLALTNPSRVVAAILIAPAGPAQRVFGDSGVVSPATKRMPSRMSWRSTHFAPRAAAPGGAGGGRIDSRRQRATGARAVRLRRCG